MMQCYSKRYFKVWRKCLFSRCPACASPWYTCTPNVSVWCYSERNRCWPYFQVPFPSSWLFLFLCLWALPFCPSRSGELLLVLVIFSQTCSQNIVQLPLCVFAILKLTLLWVCFPLLSCVPDILTILLIKHVSAATFFFKVLVIGSNFHVHEGLHESVEYHLFVHWVHTVIKS